jgi:hypothetical protein
MEGLQSLMQGDLAAILHGAHRVLAASQLGTAMPGCSVRMIDGPAVAADWTFGTQ